MRKQKQRLLRTGRDGDLAPVTTNSSAISQVRCKTLLQLWQTKDQFRLIVEQLRSVHPERAGSHSVPEHQRKEAHIGLTWTKREGRTDLPNQIRPWRGLCRTKQWCCHSCTPRKGQRFVYKKSRARSWL